MAHLHGAAKQVMEHGTQVMAPRMMMSEGVSAMMPHGMSQATSFHNVAKGAAVTGAVASVSSHTGRSFMSKLLKNPWVLFGLGVTVGYMAHKHRKDIIATANRVAEKSKDFVLQQRESLEDIMAENRESED